MKAMILAAGLGTRLRPLTDERPKALVEIGGRTLLEITLRRLRGFGIREVMVNVHHFGGMVVEYLRANDNFGMRVEISREEELLDTGGGLKKAAGFFLRDAGEEPFVLHNVDVLSSIDVAEMARFHGANKALATLAVMNRESSRQLLFDGKGRLCGRRSAGEAAEMVGGQGVGYGPTDGPPVADAEAGDGPPVADAGATDGPPAAGAELAFCGVHVISPGIFARMDEGAAFPIIPTYLRLAGEGEKIAAFRADAYYWRDLGTVASLRMAAEDVARGAVEA